jgi:hypothetical protein
MSYPLKPPTVSPPVWDISRRNVTFSHFVNPLSGTFHVLSFLFTSSPSESLPRSTRQSAPAAVTGLLIEPAWNSVLGVMGVVDPPPIAP